MAFVSELCSQEVFDHLMLPQELIADEKTSPIGHTLIFDRDSRSALIPRPFHYSDYPDRNMTFFVKGCGFNAWELIRQSAGPDRVEIYFNKRLDPSERAAIVSLLRQAVYFLSSDKPCLLPVVEVLLPGAH